MAAAEVYSPHLLLILIGKFPLNTNTEVPFAYE